MASSVIAFLIAFAIIMSLSQPMTAATTKLRAQKRDFLTMKEIEKLQEAQRIDLRVKLLVGSADIRFALLGARPMPKRSAKDWGEPPSGTREELLRDIDRIIMKAIDDLDYAASLETDSRFFQTAFSSLRTSCEEYEGYLRKLLDDTSAQRERGVILNALERCEQVAEASSKLP